MKAKSFFLLLLLLHGFLVIPLGKFLQDRPVEVKLGYLPHPQVLHLTTADHDLLTAQAAVIKVLFYYGSLFQKFQENVIVRPEYANMYRTLQTAVSLDPYNGDAYYFAQAAFTWELGRISEVNAMLEKGVQHRNWDGWLPFYLGFNHAYFLKEYAEAAQYLQIDAQISGNPLFGQLAARYFYESEQTELGLAFLDVTISQAKEGAMRQAYEVRREALLSVWKIETALQEYRSRLGRNAEKLDELLKSGLLESLPADPYGGEFYLDQQGRVRSTSKFANPNF